METELLDSVTTYHVAVPWTDKEFALPVDDVLSVDRILYMKTGQRAKRMFIHPTAIPMIASCESFKSRVKIYGVLDDSNALPIIPARDIFAGMIGLAIDVDVHADSNVARIFSTPDSTGRTYEIAIHFT